MQALKKQAWSRKPPPGAKLNLSHPLARGLIGFWPFNEAAGISVYDRTGRLTTGSFNTTPVWSQGLFGPCIKLDGSSYIDFGAVAFLMPAAITMSVWVNMTTLSGTDKAVFSAIAGGAASYHQILVKATGKLAMWTLPTVSVSYDGTGTYTLSANVWYHVVLTYDSVIGLNGYVNGRLDKNAAANGALNTTTANTQIGNDSNTAGRKPTGLVDLPMVWNRALNPTEIWQLYTNPLGMFARTPQRVNKGTTAKGLLSRRRKAVLAQ